MDRSQSNYGRTTAGNASSFESFLEGWLIHHQHFLDELSAAQQHPPREEDLRNLISRVFSHYEDYCNWKSIESSRNVYRAFAAVWLTPYERTFLWIAGFKPSLAIQIAANAVSDLSADQREMLQQLAANTTVKERMLEERLAMTQESVGYPALQKVARRLGGLRDGALSEAVSEEPIQELGRAMEEMLRATESLRMRTANGVVEILSPIQSVRFLAEAARIRLRVRRIGLQKEAERCSTSGEN